MYRAADDWRPMSKPDGTVMPNGFAVLQLMVVSD